MRSMNLKERETKEHGMSNHLEPKPRAYRVSRLKVITLHRLESNRLLLFESLDGGEVAMTSG